MVATIRAAVTDISKVAKRNPAEVNGQLPLVAMRSMDPPRWFGKKETGLKVGPLTWQGRAATFLYCFLVVVAIFTYSELTLTAFVVLFYTLVFATLVFYKSELVDNWPPGSGSQGNPRTRTDRR
jgi:hypothetical protein